MYCVVAFDFFFLDFRTKYLEQTFTYFQDKHCVCACLFCPLKCTTVQCSKLSSAVDNDQDLGIHGNSISHYLTIPQTLSHHIQILNIGLKLHVENLDDQKRRVEFTMQDSECVTKCDLDLVN